MRRLVAAIASVVVAGTCAAVATGKSETPPPSEGFDTSACHGRAPQPLRNGPLIGRLPKKDGLYTVRRDGSQMRRLARPPRHYLDFHPAPSPDGREVAFARVFQVINDRPVRLMVVDIKTHHERVVLADIFEDYAPAWSPDGQWITAGVEVRSTTEAQVRTSRLIHPDGTGLHAIDAGGYLLLNPGWSPNGRCLAGHALFQDRGPTSAYTGNAGMAVLSADGGRPNTFLPTVPCPRSDRWSGCTSSMPRLSLNSPTYVTWTLDGRDLVTLRGLWHKPGSYPDRMDIARSPVTGDGPGKVLVNNADLPHLAPDGRFIAGYSIKRRAAAVYKADGRRVKVIEEFVIDAWAPARR